MKVQSSQQPAVNIRRRGPSTAEVVISVSTAHGEALDDHHLLAQAWALLAGKITEAKRLAGEAKAAERHGDNRDEDNFVPDTPTGSGDWWQG